MTRIDSTGREVCEYCGYGVPQHSENCDRPFPPPMRFEYHCWESEESADADLWHRSGQALVAAVHDEGDHDCLRSLGLTFEERGAEGQPCTLRVTFADGHVADAWEDEVITDA